MMKVIENRVTEHYSWNFVRQKVEAKSCVLLLLLSVVLFAIILEKNESMAVQCFRYAIEDNYSTRNLIETKDDKERDLLIAEGGSLDVTDSFAFAMEEEARYVMLINQVHIYFLGRESCCIKVKDYLCEGEQMKVTIVKTVLEPEPECEHQLMQEPEHKNVQGEKDFQGQSFYLSRSME